MVLVDVELAAVLFYFPQGVSHYVKVKTYSPFTRKCSRYVLLITFLNGTGCVKLETMGNHFLKRLIDV